MTWKGPMTWKGKRARKRRILVADLFCGAGGSSTGCQHALDAAGLELDLVAVNHWDLAIDTHTKNHPNARHHCVNLDEARPRALVPEGYLDLLMASPECTHHSQARGGRPISDQSRMSAWHVVRWCTELRVRAILVENVPEFMTWGPLDGDDRPIPERKGEYFRAWAQALEAIGFRLEWKVINAADHGDPTTRKRFFLLGRSDGEPIRWPKPSHAKDGAGGLPRWRAAREVIDWSLSGRSIFNRKKPLSKKTLARILAGAERFGWPEAFLVVLRRHMDGLPIDGPSICANGTHVGLAQPVVIANRSGNAPRSTSEPVPPATTSPGGGLYVATPFLVPQRSDADPARTVEEPLPSLTTVARVGVVEPLVVRSGMHKSNALCVRESSEPLATITSETGGGFAVVEPMLLSRHGENGGVRAKPVDEPVPTADCRGAGYLVRPFVLSQGAGGAPRETGQPLPAIPTDGAHAFVEPVLEYARIDPPGPAIRPGGVDPVLLEYHSKGLARDVKDPVPTLTTHDRLALVSPVTHHDASDRARSVDEPVPTVTGAARGELAFITASFGERPTQKPRVRSVDDPAPTVAATGSINLVSAEPQRIDILFRMLTPKELARAMSFDDGEIEYEFVGNKTQVTKQIGNAVPVRTASALVGALLSDLGMPAKRKRAKAKVDSALQKLIDDAREDELP